MLAEIRRLIDIRARIIKVLSQLRFSFFVTTPVAKKGSFPQDQEDSGPLSPGVGAKFCAREPAKRGHESSYPVALTRRGTSTSTRV